MKAVNGKLSPEQARQRKALLAKVHIAAKDLGFTDVIYRDILNGHYGAESAGHLSLIQLEDLVEYFRKLGWAPKKKKRTIRDGSMQVSALRRRAQEIAREIENGDSRLAGLVKRICDVERLEWCHDVRKLKGLLAALEKISREYNRDMAQG